MHNLYVTYLPAVSLMRMMRITCSQSALWRSQHAHRRQHGQAAGGGVGTGLGPTKLTWPLLSP